MPGLATAWFRPARLLETAWMGPLPAVAEALARGADPQAIPVLIGPPGTGGAIGPQGDPGPPGESATDDGFF